MSDLHRVHNFNAGPGALPLEVLQQAQAELLDFKGTGMSVMEMSHRSKEFESVIKTAEADLRDLLGISNDYKIMFPRRFEQIRKANIEPKRIRIYIWHWRRQT